MVHLILCGGVGSRLWPLSRTQLPKQFARILPGDSFFEACVRRNLPLTDKVLIASNAQQVFLASSQLTHLGIQNWSAVVEPVGRNTAPAIALACMTLPPDEIVIVTPSDHLVRDVASYHKAVEQAILLARQDRLVTFGIRPEYPETGYGYIEADGESVVSFREKPDEGTARQYVSSGRYFWNSGMFCFKAGVFLSELALCSPSVFAAILSCFETAAKGKQLKPQLENMQQIPSISIDYAVLEKSRRVSVVPCDIGWSDVGSYDALRECLVRDSENSDDQGNISSSTETPIFIDSTSNFVLAKRRVALVGVDDLLIVESPDALLIAKRGRSQEVKQVVGALNAIHSPVVDVFPRVERSWGNHEVVHNEEGYKVNRVEIVPGARLSLHSHLHRREIWTMVRGTATVILDNHEQTVVAGQTISVPPKTLHRLENRGTENVIIIETQIGSSISEVDIERYEDDYR